MIHATFGPTGRLGYTSASKFRSLCLLGIRMFPVTVGSTISIKMFRAVTALALILLFSACTTTARESVFPIQFSKADTPVKNIITDFPYDQGEGCQLTSAEDFNFEYPITLDLWDRVREGFVLNRDINKRIQVELNWYIRHPSYIDRVTTRGQRYLFHAVEELEARNMPLEFALLPIVESAYDPFAYSHGRASGMWQIIPGTGKMLGLKQNWWYDGRRDITASTNAALTYLERLHRQFDGDWLLALAAYNSGAGNVSRAIRKNRKKGLPTDYWSLDLPKETEAYVPRLLALSSIFAEPHVHDVDLAPIANEPTFEVVDVGSQIDLAQAAAMAGLSMREFYLYNPGFNRWATDPDGPHQLLIPIDAAPTFKAALAALPADQRVTWERYTIKNGDALSTIATRYSTTVDLLQSINQLQGHSIRAGKTLLVPRASKETQHYVLSASQRLAATQQKGKGKREVYVVKAGDSFWEIGKKLGVPSGQLAKWNGLAPRDPIRPGQKLVVWRKGKSSTTNTTRKVAYKVRKGDSLARIADKFDIRIADIVNWNKVNPKNYLQPGDFLTLFVDVTNVTH